MTSLRFFLYSLALLLASLSVPASAALPVLRGVGGDFSAMSTLGHEVSPGDFSRPVLLFFGYTNCSDICPATLAHLANLTRKGEVDVQVLFVTVDPDHDTLPHLKAYLEYFDPRFIGISDQRARIDAIVQLFQARYSQLGDRPLSTQYKKLKIKKPGTEGNDEMAYLYTHSATIYLIDPQGRTRATYFNGTPVATMRADIEQLNAAQLKAE